MQGQKWFNEWQVKVDVYTMWIYKWQYILDEAVNNYTKATNAASHPETNAMVPDEQPHSVNRDPRTLYTREAAMTAPTVREITKFASDKKELASIVPVVEETIKLFSIQF